MDHLYCSRKLRQMKILQKSTFHKKDQLCFWQMSWISASNNWRAIFHLFHHFWQLLSGITQAGENCCIIVNGITAITMATNYLSSLRSGRISDFQFFFTFQWRIQDFSEGMSTRGVHQRIFGKIFAEKCMKMKEFGPRGGGASLALLLVPPLHFTLTRPIQFSFCSALNKW